MRTLRFFAIAICLFLNVCTNVMAQTAASEPRPMIDGTGTFGKALAAKLDTDTDGRQRKNVHPFVIGYCGWRVRALTNYSLTKYDGMQIGLCRIILNSFDAQLTETLTAIEKNATSMIKPAEISAAESKAIQDFVVMKYGMYYMNLHPDDNAEKPDAVARWKYEVGSNLGELAAHLTIWWRIWANDKFEAKIGELLAGLDNDIRSIPKGVDTALIANLRKLNSLGSKVKFTAAERRQVNELLTQTLLSAVTLTNVANAKEPIPSGPGNLFSTPNSPAGGKTAPEYLESGKTLAAKGDHKGAIASFDQAVRLDPANPIAFFYRALSREKAGLIDDALKDYSAVILLRGSLLEAYYNRGTIHLNKKDYKNAIADFDMAINIDPKYVSAIYNRGLALYNANNLYAALADFNNVLKAQPEHVNSLIMRSYIYCAQGLGMSAFKDQELAARLGGKFERGCK